MALVLIISLCITFSISSFALPSMGTTGKNSIVSTSVIDAWYSDAHRFVTGESIICEITYNSYMVDEWLYRSETDFFGNREADRALCVSVLDRFGGSLRTLLTSGYNSSTCPTFVDVPDGQYYTPAAQWAYDNGIINGVGGAYFAPNRTITREEFAVMLYRFTEYLGEDTSERVAYDTFTDGDEVSSWANDAMSWAVAEGLISGKPDNKLAPKDTITRAEVALIIYRFNNNVKAHRDIDWWDA